MSTKSGKIIKNYKKLNFFFSEEDYYLDCDKEDN